MLQAMSFHWMMQWRQQRQVRGIWQLLWMDWIRQLVVFDNFDLVLVPPRQMWCIQSCYCYINKREVVSCNAWNNQERKWCNITDANCYYYHAKQSFNDTVAANSFPFPSLVLIKFGSCVIVIGLLKNKSSSVVVKSATNVIRALVAVLLIAAFLTLDLVAINGLTQAWEGLIKSSRLVIKTDILWATRLQVQR